MDNLLDKVIELIKFLNLEKKILIFFILLGLSLSYLLYLNDYRSNNPQIINKKLFIRNKIENFSVLEIWGNLLAKNKLYGYESRKDFYHLTDLNIFKRLKDL